MDKKIVILGAGPTGLGAAWRLQELKYDNFILYERNSYPGGLAASFTDDKGFTWDIGGHVLFSHYPYFDNLMLILMKDEWLEHNRESWIWIKDTFVPYPFQNNIKYLPKEDILKCLNGLVELYDKRTDKAANFREWIFASFGQGIAELFMIPYNYKVWATPAEKMSFSWIGERVSVIDLKKILKNVILDIDEVSWGPNNKFKFPLRGGTGAIFNRLYEKIDKKKILLNHEVIKIDTKNKQLKFSNGKKDNYDILITTMPLDRFLAISDIADNSSAGKLMHSSTHVIGLGLKGNPPDKLKTKCWMYFPEEDCPFYRVTVLSNYSHNNVPDIKKNWSLLLEVSESKFKKVNRKKIVDEVIQGAINTKLIKSKEEIIDIWYHFEEYGYPTPSLERDAGLKILTELEKKEIYSRGRFGAWKYEVGNMDHSVMQGVETINRLLKQEEENTVWHPEIVNKKK